MALQNIMEKVRLFDEGLMDVTDHYVRLALAKENPEAAGPVDPALEQRYLQHSPTPLMRLEGLQMTYQYLHSLAANIAASGMQPAQYFCCGLVGVLLPPRPANHHACFPGVGYVTCPATEGLCRPLAIILHCMSICVVLSWLRSPQEMQPWWQLYDELFLGTLPLALKHTVRLHGTLHLTWSLNQCVQCLQAGL